MAFAMKPRWLIHGALIVALAGLASSAWSQTQTSVGVPGRGNLAFGVQLQHVTITKRDLIIVKETFGEVTLRSAWFSLDYGLTDRLALTATLPYKSNRYIGDQPHDPRLLLNDHGQELLDNGQFHSNWGDFGLNLRWLWRTDPVAITPFIGYYTPSNDYPLFTETQAGRGQWRVDAGFNAAGRLGKPAWNAYWQFGYAYSFMEKTHPSDAPARRVNHSQLSVELGWRATPRLTPYITLNHVSPHNGMELPEFIGIPYSDQFYWHDQLLAWEFTTYSLGVSLDLPRQSAISMAYGRPLNVKFGHLYEPALSLSYSRGFSTNRSRGFPGNVD